MFDTIQTYRAYRQRGYEAHNALALARKRSDPQQIYPRCVESRVNRDSNGMMYLGERPEDFGLRFVGYARCDGGYRNGYFSDEPRGWYSDDHGETFFGVVYQLPARNGESRFVAGYNHSDMDGCLVFDFKNIYTENRRDGSHWDCVTDLDGARDAAISADHMAEKSAELEREYQTAWHAGCLWSETKNDIADLRTELVDLLAERRAVKNAPSYPALCKAIQKQVSTLLESIYTLRERRDTLARGDDDEHYFYPDKRLQEAFNDGADCY